MRVISVVQAIAVCVAALSLTVSGFQSIFSGNHLVRQQSTHLDNGFRSCVEYQRPTCRNDRLMPLMAKTKKTKSAQDRQKKRNARAKAKKEELAASAASTKSSDEMVNSTDATAEEPDENAVKSDWRKSLQPKKGPLQQGQQYPRGGSQGRMAQQFNRMSTRSGSR
uniref:Uncharacterized protein n=1 Tax=Fibrocapsa japonica TaxID=94617 RepID=A0A7S2V5E6_9STRA|mmetsp:Transcript_7450/g.11256  ORF Transcript_7450/g.11256 Transcript_7450/m.11256 type:complete len:166 (+) Transcript_7450:56-553(+)